ncbi:putative ribonuclease H-like domain-containing protein [Tanacetum coccineum]
MALLSMRARKFYQRTRRSLSLMGAWDMAEDEIQRKHGFMAFTGSGDDTAFKASTYKRGLSILEGQIIKYKESEVLFSKEIALLKISVGHKEYLMGLLKTKIEKVKEEKEGFKFKIAKFEKSLKDLDQLLASQITNKIKKGFGYNVVPSPHPLILNRPTPLDLSYSGLQEFKQPEVNEYGLRDSNVMPITGCDKESDNSKENTDDSLKQQQKIDSSLVKSPLKVDKDWKEMFFCPANQVREEEPKKARENNDAPIIEDWVSYDEEEVEPILKVEKKTAIPAANKKESVKTKKPIRRSVSCPNAHKHMVPRAILMKTGLKTVNNVRPVNTVRQTVNTGRQNVNTIRARGFNAVKPSACWVWRLSNHGASLSIPRSPNDKGFVDSGCSRHMFGNIAHLLDFKDFDGGYVTFGGGANGGRIMGKGRLGHVNFKNINKLVKENLVRDLPLKRFENDQTCVACLKGKQHRASYNDDYSRFSWVFFLRTKDETSEILKNFIKEIENLVDKKVKIIRSDNGTEFKNNVMDEFCREKGIKREYSVARTPQQNGVAERKNRTLIEAARTMLADSKLPTTFWAEAISTACYVQNRVLIVKPHNKTPYELFRGIKPAIGFMKPFGCHVTILNTLDKLGKFDGKSDEGFFVGYSLSSKAFRVYNIRTRKVQENLHVGFLENKPMLEGNGPKWLFDLDSLTQSMNYVPVVAGTFSNDSTSIQGVSESSTSSQQDQDCIVMPIWKDASYFDDASLKSVADAQIQDQDGTHDDCSLQDNGTADQQVNTASPEVNTGSREVSTVVPEVNTATPEDLIGPIPTSEDTQVEDQEIELGNISPSYAVSSTPHTRIHKDHPIDHVIGDVQSSVQTRRMTTSYSELGFLGAIYEGKTHQDLHTCLCYRARIEALSISWLLLLIMGRAFTVLPIGCQKCFLYGQIEEEVYVCQPLGFEDPDHPDKVYKVYDIIFGSTKKELCDEFEKLMKDKFQMRFLSEDSLSSKQDILVVHVCAIVQWFQCFPKTSHLLAVKRIFRYLKGKPSLGSPMIEGNGPKWLFDLDSLTQSMNYVPVVAGTFSNDFAGKQGVSESSTSSQQDQDCIVMPIWKDASYFGYDAPRSVADAQIQDKDRLQDKNDATEKSHEDSSLKDNGTADQQEKC